MTNRFCSAVSVLSFASLILAGCGFDRYDGPPYGPTLTLEASQRSGPADGNTPLCFVVSLKDGMGRPMVAAAIEITSSDASARISAAPPTDALGSTQSCIVTAEAGVARVLAQYSAGRGSLTASASMELTFTAPQAPEGGTAYAPGTPDTEHTTLQPNPSSLVADGTSLTTLTLRVRDAFGHGVPHVPVTWSVLPQTTLSHAMAVTDADGNAVAQAASTLAQIQTVSAIMPTATASAAVAWTPGAASFARSSWVADANTLVANDADSANLVLTLADAFNNAIGGQPVSPPSLGGQYSYSPASGVTDANGQWVTSLRGTLAGGVNSSLAAAGLSFSQTLTFVPGPADSAKSTFVASPNTAVADGNATIVLSGSFVDAYNNVLSNQAFTLTTTSGTTVLMPANGLTSPTGTLAGTASSSMVLADTISVSLGGTTLNANVIFTPGPADAAKSSLTASPSTGVASDGQTTSQLVLSVRDAQSRGISGLTTHFMGYHTDSILGSSTATTNSAGQSTATVTSTTAGVKAFRAQVGSLSFSTTVTFAGKTPFCSNNVVLGVRPTYLQVSGYTAKLRAVDLDGDGKQDILVAGTYAPVVSVFYNSGGGSFTSPVKLGYEDHAQDFVAVDLDGDGFQDIVAVNNANYLITFKGGPSRSFASSVEYGLNGNFSAVCSADINKDGKPDIVAVSSANSPGFGVFMGDGAGSYSSATFYPTAGAPTSCVAQDLDQDGYVDLAITNNATNTVDIYAGNSAGTYSGKTSYNVGASPNAIAAGLLDGDGFLDLVVTNGDINVGTVSVLLSNGSGGYLPQAVYPTDQHLNDLKLHDVDGDGNLDIVVAAGYMNLATTNPSIPDGVAGNSVNILLGGPDGSFSALKRVAGGGSVQTAAAADFDGDGYADVAYGMSLASTAGVAFSAGNMNFQNVTQYHTPLGPDRIIPADLNHDGIVDLVASSTYDTFNSGGAVLSGVFMGATPGTFKTPQPLSAISYNHGMGIGDFNGDGNLDIIGVQSNGTGVSIGLGTGDGNFAISSTNLLPANIAAYSSFNIMIQDLNGDGKSDVVLVDENTNNLYVLTSTGNSGSFSIRQVPYPAGQMTCHNSGALVDINNDGYTDIALPCRDLLILMGGPSGDYSQSYTFTSPQSGFKNLVIMDLNQDGFIDIVTENSWDVVIFTNNQDETFTAQPKFSFLLSGDGDISTADLNGDGYLDLLKANANSLSLFYGAAGGGLGPEVRYPAGQIQSVTAYDIDQDGRQDVITAVRDEGLVIYPSTGCAP